MSASEKIENWSAKSVSKIDSVKKTSFTYHIKKFRIEKNYAAPPIHHRDCHGQLPSLGGESVKILDNKQD